MKESKEYRIYKTGDLYFIEIKYSYTKGILWWRKIFTEWVACNAFGEPRFNNGTTDAVPAPKFNSLESAKIWLDGINRDPKYKYFKY
jgi:hypothetical protein